MARKATADSAVKAAPMVAKDDAPDGATDAPAPIHCPAHGPFVGEACPGCLSHMNFTAHERMRMMLMEAALQRALPYLAQLSDAARSNPAAFPSVPKVHDDYLALQQAIEFSTE